MLLLGIAIGCVIGFLLACYGCYSLVIGTLKLTRDDYDGDTYMYVELDKPYIPKRKYVVMKVDRSHN